jgi:hypothetical protein
MKNFPRWRNLKHFNAVATVDFSDGQAFVDIMKVSTFLFEQTHGLQVIVLPVLHRVSFIVSFSFSARTTRFFMLFVSMLDAAL